MVAIGLAALSTGGLIVATKSSAVFLACLAPFLWYIIPTYLAKEPELTKGVSTSFIYSYYRLSHHLGIFNTLNYFLDKHLIGSILTAASFSLLVIYRKWIAINVSKTLWLTATVGFGVSLLFVGIAYVDSQVLNRSGELVKYYPFRLNALASFISLFLIIVLTSFSVNSKISKNSSSSAGNGFSTL